MSTLISRIMGTEKVFGKKVDGAMDRLLSKKEEPIPAKEQIPVKTSSNINLSDYIIIPSISTFISKYEVAGFNNMNYEDTHKKLLQSGLYMPSPFKFMLHFQNVVNAHAGKGTLHDGAGRQIAKNEVEDLYKHLTTNHISAYKGGQEGAWTWLNARFVQGSGHQGLYLEEVTGIDSRSNLLTKKTPLEACVWKDCYVELKFNSQGLPINEGSEEYLQGANIYFYYPRKDKVARFGADSSRADLCCFWPPGYSSSSLGVFACAEGALKKA